MSIYIYNILSIPIYSFFIKRKKILIIVSCIQLFIILSFRDITVGVDLLNYTGGYNYISGLDFSALLSKLRFILPARLIYPYSYESGYVVLNWIFAKIGLSFHGFLVIYSIFVVTSIGVYIYRYSECFWMSFVLFSGMSMFIYSFGIIRQTIALCILLWAIPLIQKRKLSLFIFLLIIAFMIHRSSIIFLVLYFSEKISLNKKKIFIFLLFCLALMVISPIIYDNIVISFVSKLGMGGIAKANFRFNYQILLMFIIAVLILIFSDNNIFINKKTSLILKGYCLSIPIEIVGMCNDTIARAVEYYYIFVILAIPLVIKNYNYALINAKEILQKNLINGILNFTIILSMCFLLVHSIRNSPLVPYKLYSDINTWFFR